MGAPALFAANNLDFFYGFFKLNFRFVFKMKVFCVNNMECDDIYSRKLYEIYFGDIHKKS